MHDVIIIYDSWSPFQNFVYDIDTIGTNNAIGALCWDTKETFIRHFKSNFCFSGWTGLASNGIVLIISLIIEYITTTNFLPAFRCTDKTQKEIIDFRTAISLIFIITALTLTPMYLALSCDTGRLMFYSVMTSTLTALIIKPQDIISCCNKNFVKKVISLNKYIDSIIVPTKGLLMFFTLFFGLKIMTCYFLGEEFSVGPVGTLLKNLDLILH